VDAPGSSVQFGRKRGQKARTDLRGVMDDVMLYIPHAGCQCRFLPESFGP
jgi:hypothetical protein